MNYPIVFVSYDMKFYKVFSLDAKVTPYKDIMACVDNIFVGDDTVYFTTTMNHLLLVALLSFYSIPYEIMMPSNDFIVRVMSNRVQFSPAFKDYCVDTTRISMFHTIYKFYDTCVQSGQLQRLSQTNIDLSQLQAQIISMQQQVSQQVPSENPKDTKEENMGDIDIDHLFEQWSEQEPYNDGLDEFLDRCSFDDMSMIDLTQDDISSVV